ncbi:MAG TPA: hypothetical protein VKU60_02380 [Chloroflexota bacterium]|nr:hypothetical protein [Chloroflexota bacterium]HZP23198.1 hypothetical protein [Terriglobales bacterium]
MLSFFEDFILVVFTVSAALIFMVGLNRAWPAEKRRNHNELIGWQLSILGTTYAVILGFMLYTVWTDFGVADVNVDQEASALSNIYALAGGLPEPQRSQMKTLARSYADAAVRVDWPEMSAGHTPEATFEINNRMWTTLMSLHSSSATEVIAEDHSLSELSALTAHRRARLLQAAGRLPGVLWCVLLIGGVLTISSCCMFGSESPRLHAWQVFAFSLLIALALVAIANINRPFQGGIHIDDLAFERVQQFIRGQ